MSGAEEPIRFSNPLHGEDDTVVPATDDAAVAPAEADAVAPAEADAVAPAELDAADEPAAATDPTAVDPTAIDPTDEAGEGVDPTAEDDEEDEDEEAAEEDQDEIKGNVSSAMDLQTSVNEFKEIWTSMDGTGTGQGQLYVFTSFFAMLSLITLMDFKWPFLWLYSLSWIKFFAFPFKFLFPVQFFLEDVEVGQATSFYMSLLCYPAMIATALVRRSFFDSKNANQNQNQNEKEKEKEDENENRTAKKSPTRSVRVPTWLSGTRQSWIASVWAEPKGKKGGVEKFKYKNETDEDWSFAEADKIPQLLQEQKLKEDTLIRSDEDCFTQSEVARQEKVSWKECLTDDKLFEPAAPKTFISARMLVAVFLWLGPPAISTLIESSACSCIFISNFTVVWFMGGTVVCPTYVVYKFVFVQKFQSEVKERELPEDDFFNAWAGLEGQLFLFLAITMHLNTTIAIIQMLIFDPNETNDLFANETLIANGTTDGAVANHSHDSMINLAKAVAWAAILPYSLLPLWAINNVAKTKQHEEMKEKDDDISIPPWYYAQQEKFPDFKRNTTGFWSLIGTKEYRNAYKEFDDGKAYNAYWDAEEDDSDGDNSGALDVVMDAALNAGDKVLNPGKAKHDDDKLYSDLKYLEERFTAAHTAAKKAARDAQHDPKTAVAPVWTEVIITSDADLISSENSERNSTLDEEKKLLRGYYLKMPGSKLADKKNKLTDNQKRAIVDKRRTDWFLENDGKMRVKAIERLIERDLSTGGADAFDAAAYSLISAFTDLPITSRGREERLAKLNKEAAYSTEEHEDEAEEIAKPLTLSAAKWGDQGWWFMKRCVHAPPLVYPGPFRLSQADVCHVCCCAVLRCASMCCDVMSTPAGQRHDVSTYIFQLAF